MEEVTDEPLYLERVCGIDIGKAASSHVSGAIPDRPGTAGAGDPQLRHHR
jgi:hypothetical protein